MDWSFNKTYIMYKGKLNELTNISKIFIISDFSNQYSVLFHYFLCEISKYLSAISNFLYAISFYCVFIFISQIIIINIRKIMNYELESYSILESSINICFIFLILTSSFVSSAFTLFWLLLLTSYLFFLVNFTLQKFFSRFFYPFFFAVKVWAI